jgi:ethanolamine ammonia-lyase small subunit
VTDPWKRLRSFTQARIGLSRSGHAVSTEVLLEFQHAHAEARDAVKQKWDVTDFAAQLKKMNEPSVTIESMVTDRDQFLKRPDLGRKLSPNSQKLLKPSHSQMDYEIVFLVSDGLSANAVDKHATNFWKALTPHLKNEKLSHAPIVLAPFSRVALSDEVGAIVKAKLAVMMIGERPGLSSPDSLGIYLTYNPKLGNHDANRNCISNIRPPNGLNYDLAAQKLIFLIKESLRLQLSGVRLKEHEPALTAVLKT